MRMNLGARQEGDQPDPARRLGLRARQEGDWREGRWRLDVGVRRPGGLDGTAKGP